MEPAVRLAPIAAALTLALAAGLAPAQENRLPDIGSSAGELLTPARQEQYGRMMLAELRNYGYVLDDPLIDDWLQTMGSRLGASSDQPRQRFTFFMLRERQINAFATLGGYIAVNSGLVLTADREDEVAAVLSHEIAHVTQQHVLRAVERAKRDRVPILLGMLAAVIAAQQAGGSSSGDATMASVTSAMGLLAQRQIDYTRANEAEADRLGIRTLARSGYDVDAMAAFFERMSLAMRGNQGGYAVPDYLQSHPVTLARIGEAKARAEQMKKNTVLLTTSIPGGVRQERVDPADPSLAEPLGAIGNPLLPFALKVGTELAARGPTGQFDWAKERLRVLTANTPSVAIREYEDLRRGSGTPLTDPQRYGLALARLRNSSGAADAAHEFAALLEAHPDNLWLELALAEAQARQGPAALAQAQARLDALVRQLPANRAVALGYAAILNGQGTAARGRRARQVLEGQLADAGDAPSFQQAYARACELSGDTSRASEAYAEAAYLNGRPEQALLQLQALKKRGDLDYVTRARVDARIAAITPTVLEMQRQGIDDPDMGR